MSGFLQTSIFFLCPPSPFLISNFGSEISTSSTIYTGVVSSLLYLETDLPPPFSPSSTPNFTISYPNFSPLPLRLFVPTPIERITRLVPWSLGPWTKCHRSFLRSLTEFTEQSRRTMASSCSPTADSCRQHSLRQWCVTLSRRVEKYRRRIGPSHWNKR
ncbi:Protein of unknown function [Pyronema omphalodes CBS 100304]|uniref:Uncharacterized protein n=1 Tax=Pyronema omphalodes (strain CBS 100304) TaxID=1076935 RepID=U4LP40_PYROM|nr:Protein of unknown function [Pyronema omphalodes CBS 100304]